MPHLEENRKPVPFTCEQCTHFIEGCRCKAFDTIPIEIIFDAERHSQKIDGQKGDYVFVTIAERQFTNVYEVD